MSCNKEQLFDPVHYNLALQRPTCSLEFSLVSMRMWECSPIFKTRQSVSTLSFPLVGGGWPWLTTKSCIKENHRVWRRTQAPRWREAKYSFWPSLVLPTKMWWLMNSIIDPYLELYNGIQLYYNVGFPWRPCGRWGPFSPVGLLWLCWLAMEVLTWWHIRCSGITSLEQWRSWDSKRKTFPLWVLLLFPELHSTMYFFSKSTMGCENWALGSKGQNLGNKENGRSWAFWLDFFFPYFFFPIPPIDVWHSGPVRSQWGKCSRAKGH